MDFGFEAAGFGTRVASEIDATCCETLRKNRDWSVIERDVFEVSTEELLSTAKLQRGEAALVCGGPPCQPFSKAGFWANGTTARLNDPRANTLGAFLRVVREALPAAFVLENVAGIAFVNKDEGLKFLLEQVSHINKTEGVRYKPFCSLLHGTQHGVPQQRDRLFVIALRDGADFNFPPSAFAENGDGASLLPLPALRNAWDALGDLPEFPETGEGLAVTGKWAPLLPSIPEGQNYLWHTERGGGEPLFGWRRRFWNFLLKLAKNRPAWTIAAHPGPATGPFHWKNRRLSMRELCRLQTFPDDVVLVGDSRVVQRQAGNAVPSLLTEIIGRELAQILGGTSRDTAEPTLLPPKREPVPQPEKLQPVPSHFLRLRNIETAHPGTGKGYGASRRDAVDAEGVRA